MTHAGFPDSVWRAYQSSCPPSSPDKGAVGSWRKGRPKGCRGESSGCTFIKEEVSPGCSSFFCWSPLSGYALVRKLPMPRFLALCPRAVGGAPVSLVGRPDRLAPPFQPSLPYHSLGDRCIVLRERRKLGAPLPFPAAPTQGPGAQPAHPAQPGGPGMDATLPEHLTTPATRVSGGGMNEVGYSRKEPLYLLP